MINFIKEIFNRKDIQEPVHAFIKTIKEQPERFEVKKDYNGYILKLDGIVIGSFRRYTCGIFGGFSYDLSSKSVNLSKDEEKFLIKKLKKELQGYYDRVLRSERLVEEKLEKRRRRKLLRELKRA